MIAYVALLGLLGCFMALIALFDDWRRPEPAYWTTTRR